MPACGDDVSSTPQGGTDSGGANTSTGSTGDAAASSSSTSDGAASSSSGPIDGSSSSGEPAVEPEFARDIRLERLTANQATQVQLVAGGIEVQGDDYNTRIIAGRRTLIRGFWSLHANFEPREILGRLTIDYPDGTQLEQDFVQMVQGQSGDGAGASSFQWLLDPEQIVPGMTYRVRLFEVEGSEAPGEVSDPPPVAPLAGPGTLQIYDIPLELRVVLVPVQHEFEGCSQTPDITEEDVEAMRIELEQNNPVQRAVFEIREPMVYTDSIAEGPAFSPVLAALAQLRAEDDPDPSVFYYGLLDSCDGFPAGLGGQAIAIAGPPTMENAQERISTGRWNGSGAAAAGTFVHEVGHTQGRRHVRCSGGEAGIDAAYPHTGGRIGVWGFGIYDFELRSPSGGRDYMTYCSNEWVSDYGWEQTLEVIEVLTGFDVGARPDDGAVVLAGLLHEDGTADWWTQRGTVPDTTTDGTAHFEVAGNGTDVPVSIKKLPHGDKARYVQMPLTTALRGAEAIQLDAPGLHRSIDPATIRFVR